MSNLESEFLIMSRNQCTITNALAVIRIPLSTQGKLTAERRRIGLAAYLSKLFAT
jgi:hypothetical protein